MSGLSVTDGERSLRTSFHFLSATSMSIEEMETIGSELVQFTVGEVLHSINMTLVFFCNYSSSFLLLHFFFFVTTTAAIFEVKLKCHRDV